MLGLGCRITLILCCVAAAWDWCLFGVAIAVWGFGLAIVIGLLTSGLLGVCLALVAYLL